VVRRSNLVPVIQIEPGSVVILSHAVQGVPVGKTLPYKKKLGVWNFKVPKD
jgi:hypothetical protein